MTPLQVGLTGNIGSGKSSVARLFAERGAAVIDADALAREATEDPVVLREIVAVFGNEVLEKGALDRAALAARVFGNPDAKADLNAIIHPWVGRERAARTAVLAAQVSPPAVVIYDVPLLFEVGLDTELDTVVVVDAPLELRVARVISRSGLTADEVRARDAAQLPLAEKVRHADFVVDNSGRLGDLEPQVEAIWRALTS